MKSSALVFASSTSKVVLAVVMTWALTFAPIAAPAQNRPDTKDKKAADSAPAQQSAPSKAAANTQSSVRPKASGGPNEGIKVHGHWALEVRNPDGTFVSHTEFENALSGGDQSLALMLSHISSPGRWEVSLTAGSGQIPPCQGGTGGRFADWCRIIESQATNPTGGTAESRDLTVTNGQNLNGTTGWGVAMVGTITALVDGTVGRVSTSFGLCLATTATQDCNSAGSAILFTDVSLGFPGKPPTVPVVKGQIIKVTVTISFSS